MHTKGSSFTGFTFLVRAILAVILAAMLLPAQAQAAQPRAGGDTLFASIDGSQLETLDPAVTWSSETILISAQIMETLVDYDPILAKPVAGLATMWSVSLDGLTWTFDIRAGVKFQDGSDLTGQVVQANFERWWDPGNPTHGTAEYGYFENFFGLRGTPESAIASLESSAGQFILHLTRPMSALPVLLSYPNFAIASPTAISGGQMDTHPVGTGAYLFQSWNTITSEVDLAEYTDYWGNQPQIPNVRFRNLVTPEERLAAIQANTLDIAYDIPYQYSSAASEDINVYVTHMIDPVLGYLGINRGHGALTDIRVRQAITHAIDKRRLLEQFYAPFDTLADQLLPFGVMGRVDCGGACEDLYDPQAARDLLVAAGYPNGFTINLEYRDVARIYLRDPAGVARAIRNDLAQVGIQVNVIEQESSLYIQRVMNGDVDLFLLGWGADYPHPDNFLSPILCGDYLGFGPIGPDFCDLVENAKVLQDEAGQISAYQALSQTVIDEIPMVPLVYPRNMIITRAEVAGWKKTAHTPVLFRSLFWLSGPNEVVQPEASTNIDVSGGQVVSTRIHVPQGAVDEEIVLEYTLVAPLDTANGPLLPQARAIEPAPAGPSFRITAYLNGVALENKTFLKPLELVIQHDTFIRKMPSHLVNLSIWKDGEWQPANNSCDPPGQAAYNPAYNVFSYQVCTTGIFQLSGTFETYAPLISAGITPDL